MIKRDLAILGGISLLWGSAWLLAPGLAQAAAPFAAGALSLLLSGCGLLACSLLWGGQAAPLRGNLLLSLTLFALPQGLLVLAGQHGAGGWTPLLYSLMPLMLAFTEAGWTPAMAVAPGAVLVLLNGTVPFVAAKLVWALPVLAAVGLQAYALRLLRRVYGSRALTRSLGFQLLLAAVVLAAASLAFDPPPRAGVTASSASILLLHALLAVALPYSGLVFLLTRGTFTPAQVAATQWIQTLAAAGTSLVLTRAHPPVAALLAAGVLLVCLLSTLRPAGPS